MPQAVPRVYLLHGDGDLAMTEMIDQMRRKLGDESAADLNTTAFEATSQSIGEVESACQSAPFLAARRLVIVRQPSRWLTQPTGWSALSKLLDGLPPSTALVLVEIYEIDSRHPTGPAELKPLFEWCKAHPAESLVRRLTSHHGSACVQWIEKRVQGMGGEIEPAAAQLLAEWVADDPHLAAQELEKLLDYVDHARPIVSADVERLTPFYGQKDIFAMVDAVGRRDAPEALARLRHILETEIPLSVFGMIVRQFRLILQARYALDNGLAPEASMSVSSFVAGKAAAQARNFTLPALEAIYHRLLAIDLGSKTGEEDLESALDRLIAGLTV
jgi:DNA polymerase-3 subunit delta